MNIFFDLDGTLIDSKKRVYQLFQHLTPSSLLSFDAYWDYKQRKIGHKEILETQFNSSSEAITSFQDQWMSMIELPEWLAMDQPFEGVAEYLEELSTRHTLYVVTARQSEALAIEQVKQFGWEKLFEKVLVTAQLKEKHELIKSVADLSANDWMVGDTGKDIQTGKHLGIHTAAVLTGFLNRKSLTEYEPEVMVERVTDLSF